jgi:2-amino-4-hydroxy-6-hydroxymethyldihydropteridine diphosphokinase
MVAEIECEIDPLDFFYSIKKIEAQLGRLPNQRWAERIIDLDILLWDELVLLSDELSIPHSELPNRDFCLLPILEINNQATLPNNITIQSIYNNLKQNDRTIIRTFKY